MKKADSKLYETLGGKEKNKNVRCNVCSQRCVISPGKEGLCGVRKNQGGELYSLTYGKLIAQHVDPIEKKPLFHFAPLDSRIYSVGTVGCNFTCPWCQNYDISQIRGEKQIIGEDVSPKEVVQEALDNDCMGIAYTYNEPSINIEFIKDTAKLAKKKDLKNVLVTNGYLTKESFEYLNKEGLIDAMNIDIKFSQSGDKKYKKYCTAVRGGKPVFDTIKRAYNAGMHLELTTLVIPGLNDSEEELKEIAEFIFSLDKKGEIPWHISRFFPAYKMLDKKATSLDALKKVKKIGEKIGLKNIYLGNI